MWARCCASRDRWLVGHPAVQRLLQLFPLGLQASAGQRGQRPRILLAVDHRPYHCPSPDLPITSVASEANPRAPRRPSPAAGTEAPAAGHLAALPSSFRSTPGTRYAG